MRLRSGPAAKVRPGFFFANTILRGMNLASLPLDHPSVRQSQAANNPPRKPLPPVVAEVRRLLDAERADLAQWISYPRVDNCEQVAPVALQRARELVEDERAYSLLLELCQ